MTGFDPRPALLCCALLAAAAAPAAQSCNPAMRTYTPTSRFVPHDDGTVDDSATGLTWMRCALGQRWEGGTCVGTPLGYTWQQALQAALDTEFAGRGDWRLPNIRELRSIVERRCQYPAINQTIFPGEASYWYWSASPVAGLADRSWDLAFTTGYDDRGRRSGADAVRLVRGGP